MWVRLVLFAAKNLLGEEAQELLGNILLAAIIAILALVFWLIYMVGMAFQGGGLWWLALQNPKGQEAFAQILAQHGWTNAKYETTPMSTLREPGSPVVPGGPFIGPVPGARLPVPPADQWAVMVQWADGRAGCVFQPVWLAARAWDESKYGANMATSSAGAVGYGQFLWLTWAAYGHGGDPYNFHDAIPAMARYFCALGIDKDPVAAQFGYNHSHADADYVAWLVASWPATGQPPSWHDLAALNQYDIRNWSSRAMYDEWHSAACSAATLWWFAAAYGSPLPNLDTAVIDEGTDVISPVVGLRDHTGPGLAGAFTRVTHLPATNAHLSQAQLIAQLRNGPVALDGQAWFGVGHWFVAVGADAAGIEVRESSGHNFTHLTWSQLFGEVGWSGWSVFITTPAPPANAA